MQEGGLPLWTAKEHEIVKSSPIRTCKCNPLDDRLLKPHPEKSKFTRVTLTTLLQSTRALKVTRVYTSTSANDGAALPQFCDYKMPNRL